MTTVTATKNFDIFKLEELSVFVKTLNKGFYPEKLKIEKDIHTMNVVTVEYLAVYPFVEKEEETGWCDACQCPSTSICTYDSLGGLVKVGQYTCHCF
jgi:hypothetical protein